MSAHDSVLPGEDSSRHVRVDGTGISMSWKGWKALAGCVLMVLLGSGGVVGFQFITASDLSKALIDSEQRQDNKLLPVKEEVFHIKERINGIDKKIDDVQSFQYLQDARQEARRITTEIQDRRQREDEYDRIRLLNEKRLKQGKEPCYTLECIN